MTAEGDDGCIAMADGKVTLTFSGKVLGNAVKRAIGVRVYPLAAITDVRIIPAGYRGHPLLVVIVRPGCDLLRPLLKKQQPGADADPDTLILRKGSAVTDAEALAAAIRAQLLPAGSAMDGIYVDSGVVPLRSKGSSTRAVFDGSDITLEVTSWTAPDVKKMAYPRHIPAEAVADVAIDHPGMTGTLRFILAGGPRRDVPVKRAEDLNSVDLVADNSQSYAVLAAAALTAGRRAGPTLHPELLRAGPAAAGPDNCAGNPARLGLPDALESEQVNRPAPQVSKRNWHVRRAEKRAAREHDRALVRWQTEQGMLDRLAVAAHGAAKGGGCAAEGIVLKSGESVLWSGSTSLVEPRRQPGRYAGGHSGVSFRIAPGVRYSVGGSHGSYVPGPEVQTPVDSGRTAVTTHRVVFTGHKATREWSYAKLVGIDTAADDHAVLIHVTSRQKVSGLVVGKAGSDFTRFLALGIAIAQYGTSPVAAECARAAAEHRSQQPQPDRTALRAPASLPVQAAEETAPGTAGVAADPVRGPESEDPGTASERVYSALAESVRSVMRIIDTPDLIPQFVDQFADQIRQWSASIDGFSVNEFLGELGDIVIAEAEQEVLESEDAISGMEKAVRQASAQERASLETAYKMVLDTSSKRIELAELQIAALRGLMSEFGASFN
jgi:hypothetical protein